jgi:hypothetical protein
VTKRFSKRLRPSNDLIQAAVKIELFSFNGFSAIAANFIFASPRGRKVTRGACGEPQAAREESGGILSGALAE